MLQIKKSAKVHSIKYSLQFLFQVKKTNREFFLKKSKSQSIILRSPKHFNIGKQKIINVNYKNFCVEIGTKTDIHINSILNTNHNLFNKLSKYIITNTYLTPKSIKVKLKTQFIIIWPEYLSSHL